MTTNPLAGNPEESAYTIGRRLRSRGIRAMPLVEASGNGTRFVCPYHNWTYELDGRYISALNDKERSRVRNEKIGFIFQSFNLIPELNVFDNVDVPLRYRRLPGRERRRRISPVAGVRARPGDRPRARPRWTSPRAADLRLQLAATFAAAAGLIS